VVAIAHSAELQAAWSNSRPTAQGFRRIASAPSFRGAKQRSKRSPDALHGGRRSCQGQATRYVPEEDGVALCDWILPSVVRLRAVSIAAGSSRFLYMPNGSQGRLRIGQITNKTLELRTGGAVKFIPCPVASGHNAFFSFQLKLSELLEISWWAL